MGQSLTELFDLGTVLATKVFTRGMKSQPMETHLGAAIALVILLYRERRDARAGNEAFRNESHGPERNLPA